MATLTERAVFDLELSEREAVDLYNVLSQLSGGAADKIEAIRVAVAGALGEPVQ